MRRLISEMKRSVVPARVGGYVALACAVAVVSLHVGTLEGHQPGTVELSPLPLNRLQATPSLAVLGLSGSVLSVGLLAFEGGYNPADWSGVLHAVSLDADGTAVDKVWDAGAILTDTPSGQRTILTASMDGTGSVRGMAFEGASPFDAEEMKGLMSPAPAHVATDTLASRVDYLRGTRFKEMDGTMRARSSLLGAIIHAQSVYVSYPTGHYVDSWPTKISGASVPAAEIATGAQTYADFVSDNADRPPVVYIGANDGMLHAFNAPIPYCDSSSENGGCKLPADAGKELWAYVPRATYAHLGNLTSATDFQFQPTVDAAPVTRDVFFSKNGAQEWHTMLVGGLRLGGRGVYALDITRPTAASEGSPERTVLWEFDADAPPGLSTAGGRYQTADLGYTYGQPAIARLATGRWAVLIPGGYFPDCDAPDKPSDCEQAAAQAPADYGALFVLDAQTGEVISELKTPTGLDGVTGYGLSTPVLGDSRNDQIDDVAFAGDLAGNLWRFDLSASNPAGWKVTLAYQPEVQGAQPITVMPRLFPDPVTNRFIVVFGTGKYLGAGDNTTAIPIQSIYGIRDEVDGRGNPVTVTRDTLQVQGLSQIEVDGAVLRSLTSHPVSQKAGGWYIDLNIVAGERVIATPTALFNTNAVLISTLIPNGNADATPQGAVLAVDAATGGPGNAVSWGGSSYAGGMVSQPRTSGSLPMAMFIGGGKMILPGTRLKSESGDLKQPLSLDSPIWRRRSWALLMQDY
jgi:Tfp pilus tip-associated adhesin PilY1